MREALLLSIGRLICTTPWFIICCVPFYPRRRVSRRVMVSVITGSSLVFFFCNFLLRLRFGNYAAHASPMFLILYFVMVGFFIWGFRVAVVKLLYVFLLVQAVSTAINYTAAILLKPFYKGIRISLQNTLSYSLMILLLTMLLTPGIWYFFTHQLREAIENLQNRDFWLLCIPPILIFIVTLVFNDLGADPRIPQKQSISIFLLITAAGLVTYFLNVRLALDTVRRIRLEADMAAMERQIAIQAQSYKTLTQNIETARTARHDLRHHLTVMSSFAEQGNIDGLTSYLTEYRKSLPEENELQVCRHYAVDTVVRYYLQQARDAGAELDVKLDLPDTINILDTDLTIVFGNLFENASQGVVRQTGKRRFINARCGIEQKKLILTMDNSMEPDNDLQDTPGIGQSSVMAVAKKYHGTARFTRGYDLYQASVLLEIPEK